MLSSVGFDFYNSHILPRECVTTQRATPKGEVLITMKTISSEMNIAPDINNHLRTIDLFRSVII